jgi:hypothetical protein
MRDINRFDLGRFGSRAEPVLGQSRRMHTLRCRDRSFPPLLLSGAGAPIRTHHCAAECLFDVYPESFDPAPKVMSAIIKLIPHPTPPVAVNDKAVFKQLVTQAFSQRRKTLRNSLKTLVSEKGFVSLGIDPNARAETISLLDFANLSNALSDNDER